MKQSTIIQRKMWEAVTNKTSVMFPMEFYSQKDVLDGLNCLDLRNVQFDFGHTKTDKGFGAYLIDFKRNESSLKNKGVQDEF